MTIGSASTWSLAHTIASVGLALMAIGHIAVPAQAQSSPEVWRQQGWEKTDFSKTTISWHEIQSGGPPKDGIPSIDDPKFIDVNRNTTVKDTEPVIGLEINGDARAYPLRILMWHEIVNDTVGGVPVAVTYCPLCNAAIVFERQTAHGLLDFGTTGKLRNSDLVMYDRQTQSWWQQYTGKAIVGALTNTKLHLVPSRLEAFSLFRERNPHGRLLIPNDSASRAYGRNPYEGYDTSAIPFLYRGEFRAGIDPMKRVVVVREGDRPLAVLMGLLRKTGAISKGDVIIRWRSGQNSALDHASIANGRDVGNVVVQRRSADGSLIDLPYDVTFAFVFHAFHPEGEIIQSCASNDGDTTCSQALLD
ncbi:MAG: DUF3179 domain-containing protein [Hyphomicrobiaceae bacterium]|nr:DUF3179 domain-containing protein [Hyphomicrobiaceae bacterium]